MLVHDGDSDEEQSAGRLTGTHGFAILALGLSISLDEFAIGFSLGLVRLPVVPVIIAIAIVALVSSVSPWERGSAGDSENERRGLRHSH
jgi:manganese efflux pump family protein